MAQHHATSAAHTCHTSLDRFEGHAPLDDWLKAEWEVNNNFVKETGERISSQMESWMTLKRKLSIIKTSSQKNIAVQIEK
jgi:hypothetical protein